MAYKLVPVNYEVPSNMKRKDWGLSIPVDAKWSKKRKRVLFVVDHVTTGDLKNRQMLSEETGTMFLNVVDHAHKVAEQWGKRTNPDEWGYAFVNFNYFRSYDLDHANQIETSRLCVQRLKKLIKKLKPTHVHFFGPAPAYAMYGFDVEKRGWVQKYDKMTVSSNISITNQSKFDDEDEDDEFTEMNDMAVGHANLLGHASENLARMFIGHYPFSLKDLKPRFKMVDTIKGFDRLMKHLWKSKRISYDVETANLSVLQNQWLTAQFTTEKDPQLSYILPIKHKDSPWNAEQLEYIYGKLRAFFSREFDHFSLKGPILIGQNIGFDMRITRHELAIPVIYYRAWDTMCESRLDENCKALTTKTADVANDNKTGKNKPYTLDAILARYENNYYHTNSFGKDDRVTIADRDLTDKGMLGYMAMDTVAAYGIFEMQCARAKRVQHRGQSYLKPFMKLVLGVYSDTVHSMSHLSQNGLQADPAYVAKQFAVDTSDIEKIKVGFEEAIVKTKGVKKANKLLLAAEGLKDDDPGTSDSLFAGTEAYKPLWMFDIHKQDHQRLLFNDVLKLNPVAWTPSGNVSLGKEFVKHYGKEFLDKDGQVPSPNYVKEAKLFGGIREAKKTRSDFGTYYDKLSTLDGMTDGRIRAGYGFAMIVTGRSNSFDPNLQNVSQHGQYAKVIKRSFVSAMGLVNIKMDFSAHEVRMWAIMADDMALARTFQIIWNLLVHMRGKDSLSDDDKKLIKQWDTHRVNFAAFTGTPIDQVTDAQRQESKVITFGTIYGKSVKSLAAELGISVEAAQEIYDNFFGRFFKGREWLDWTVDEAAENLATFNMFDLRRHLYGHLSGDRRIIGAMNRQAMNSPIQGVASQLGYMGARIIAIEVDQTMKRMKAYGEPHYDRSLGRMVMERPSINLCAMVHDSTEVETPYEFAPLVARIMERGATTELMRYVTAIWGIEWSVRLVVDFELGDSADKFNKWDFTPGSWTKAMTAAYDNAQVRGNPITKKDLRMALKPTKRIRRQLARLPLDLSTYNLGKDNPLKKLLKPANDNKGKVKKRKAA